LEETNEKQNMAVISGDILLPFKLLITWNPRLS